MMRLRNTLILLAVLVVLLGYMFYTQSTGTAQPHPPSTPVPTPVAMLDVVTDKVSKFEVTDLQTKQTVLVTRQGDSWHMLQPKDSATDPDKIASALGSVAHLEATRVLTDVTDLSAYGLITGTIQASLTLSDTTQYTLKLGNETLDQTASYALKGDDKSKVYVIESSVATVLKDFIDLPPYPPTPTATPLPTLTPSVTPTVTPTPGPGTPSVTPAPSATP